MEFSDEQAAVDAALLVFCNCPDTAVASTLAQGIVAARLAACVNLLPEVRSVYRWQDRIETTTEVPLLIKTTRARYPALQDWLAAQHPYDVPEIIATPVVAGHAPYLHWLAANAMEN
ncbi:divalent-cation tolerance protein CutA [Silvimonas sp. JCM 19000]